MACYTNGYSYKPKWPGATPISGEDLHDEVGFPIDIELPSFYEAREEPGDRPWPFPFENDPWNITFPKPEEAYKISESPIVWYNPHTNRLTVYIDHSVFDTVLIHYSLWFTITKKFMGEPPKEVDDRDPLVRAGKFGVSLEHPHGGRYNVKPRTAYQENTSKNLENRNSVGSKFWDEPDFGPSLEQYWDNLSEDKQTKLEWIKVDVFYRLIIVVVRPDFGFKSITVLFFHYSQVGRPYPSYSGDGTLEFDRRSFRKISMSSKDAWDKK